MQCFLIAPLFIALSAIAQTGISIYPEAEFLPVTSIINKNLGAFQACYKKYLSSGGKEAGEVVLKWEIDTNGSPGKEAIVQDEINSPTLNSCLLNQLKVTNFSGLGKGKHIKVDGFPFTFKKRH